MLSFATAQMDVEGIMFNEIRQKEKLHDIIYMWNLKKYKLANITDKTRLTDTEPVVHWRGKEGGNNLAEGDFRGKNYFV